MSLNTYKKFLNFYKIPLQGTGYLAFRDIQTIINSYGHFKTALDFGCGAGRSSCYLHNIGLTVTGIDIDEHMIKNALKYSDKITYVLTKNNSIPFKNQSFDIVFNSFVLSDIASTTQLEIIFKEMRRVCKRNGLVVSVTNSDWLFQKKWLTIDNNFPENALLTDGDIAKIYLNDVSIDLYDYFWSEKTYLNCFYNSGFKRIAIKQPLGNKLDKFKWLDEKSYPPYSIYICHNF